MSTAIPIVEERAHAILSASGAHIWLHCTPAGRFQEQFEDKETEFSAEGTWAHAVAAHRLNRYLERPTEFPKEGDIPGFHKFANAVTVEQIQVYVNRCIKAIEQARAEDPEALILVEQRGDFSDWVPEGFGTADLVIIAKGRARVRDLKFGKGIQVDAEDNWQLWIYALMIIAMYRGIYDFDEVEVVIDQPRLNHVDGTDQPLQVKDLLKWADEFVRPRAAIAWEGGGEFTPGEHCRWCRGRYECAARLKANADLVDAEFSIEEVESGKITDEQVAELVPRLDGLIKWAKDLKAHAARRALAGKKWPGLKLVNGRSNRKIIDPDSLAAVLQMEGFDQALLYEIPRPPALLGITALEKVVGKKKFVELSEGYVAKPPGKLALVATSDPRPEATVDADADFEEEADEE